MHGHVNPAIVRFVGAALAGLMAAWFSGVSFWSIFIAFLVLGGVFIALTAVDSAAPGPAHTPVGAMRSAFQQVRSRSV